MSNFKDSNIKIALIIPHKNNLDILLKFINNIKKINLYSNKIDIYVIDQNNGDNFNKGILFNIGFIIALKYNEYNKFLFYDINHLINQNDIEEYFFNNNLYVSSNNIKILCMNKKDFKIINGFPNNFFNYQNIFKEILKRAYLNNIVINKNETNVKNHNNNQINLINWKKDGLAQIINIFINIKQYDDLENFIKLYYIENSNITNNAILLDVFLKCNQSYKNKNLECFFYKIDYLAKHKNFYNENDFLNKNYIDIEVNLKLKDLKKKYNNIYQSKINPTYMSVLIPLIEWKEIEDKIINTYTNPIKFKKKNKPKNKINIEVENNIENLVSFYFSKYTILNKENLFQTIKFIFDNYNEILYFRIRNNKIECSYHIYNPKNNKDWYKNLYYEKNNKKFDVEKGSKYLIESQNKMFLTLRQPHFIPANNCLLGFDSYNYFEGNPISYVQEFKEMIDFTVNSFEHLPDCDILINRKDFAYLNKDNTFAYDQLGSKEELKINLDIKKFWFIGTQSIKESNLDIPIPSADEWEACKIKNKKIEWEDKFSKAIFRGSSTGCGYNLNNNQRLLLSDISYKWSKDDSTKNLIDVKITKFTSRIKAYNKLLGIIDFKKYSYLQGDYLDSNEQLKYKYIFNIEGNAQAYRLPNELKKRSVILNIESKFFMWFEPLLKNNIHMVNILSDFSDLKEKILYLKNNDNKAKKIADNGFKFSNDYLNKISIGYYWYYFMLNINKNTNNNN